MMKREKVLVLGIVIRRWILVVGSETSVIRITQRCECRDQFV